MRMYKTYTNSFSITDHEVAKITDGHVWRRTVDNVELLQEDRHSMNYTWHDTWTDAFAKVEHRVLRAEEKARAARKALEKERTWHVRETKQTD